VVKLLVDLVLEQTLQMAEQLDTREHPDKEIMVVMVQAGLAAVAAVAAVLVLLVELV
jgi:hypothetical protein